jgi:heme/copper-type cytochrome/quinol oxidase subunit 2
VVQHQIEIGTPIGGYEVGAELPANVMRSTVSPDFARLGAEHSKQHYWLWGVMMWTVLFTVTFSIAALLTICVIVSCYTPEAQRIPTRRGAETKNP